MFSSPVAASLPAGRTVVRLRRFLTCSLLWLCLMGCGAAYAAPPSDETDKTTEEAKKLLAKVVETHKGLASYRATLQLSSSVFSAPNAEIAVCVKDKTRMAVTVKTADGEWRGFRNPDGLFTYSTKDAKRYVQHPAPDDDELTVEKLCGMAELRGLYFVLDVWSGANPAEMLARNTAEITLERTPDKPTTTVIFNLMNPEGRIAFTIDHERNWLKAVQSEVRPGRSAPVRFTEVVTAFEPTASDADVAFAPPSGAERFEIPAPPGKYDRALKPGAAPFAFRAKDMDGKAVSLDDYRGRVLLIDFWATWCGPCVAEIPTLRAVYEKYKAQGFEVLSISLDDEDTQAGVPAFIKKNNMTWRHICDGQGWETPIAQRYGVKAIPFTLLVGRDGRIAAVNLRGEALEPAVKEALAK